MRRIHKLRMIAKADEHGHIIYWDGLDWRYKDNHKIIDGTRKCIKCGKTATKEGHDACLGTLPGVKFACCGHGKKEKAYVKFANGIIIRGSVEYA